MVGEILVEFATYMVF